MRNKKIYDSWSKIKPSKFTNERILANIHSQAHNGQTKSVKKPYWRTFGPAAACMFMVLALGITIPFFIRNYGGDMPHINIPHVPDAGISQPTQPVTPINPANELSFEQAVSDPYFGKFIPESVPSGFIFDHAWRFDYEDGDTLIAFWQGERNTNIRWQISTPTDHDRERIVSAYDREKFDLSLYAIPWAESVPSELIQYVMNPVFLAEELSLEIVTTRVVQGRARNPGDAPSWQINFSVLFDNVVVNLDTTGVSPEQVWEMFLNLD